MTKYNLIKTVFGVAAAMLMASCSDWTETESVTIKYPDLKTDAPELYEQYMQSLREYRGSDHKVVIAKFDNKLTAPSGQAEHINALPDSIDYVMNRARAKERRKHLLILLTLSLPRILS